MLRVVEVVLVVVVVVIVVVIIIVVVVVVVIVIIIIIIIIIIWVSRKWDVGYGLDWGQMAGTCECGNELWSSIKCGEFLD